MPELPEVETIANDLKLAGIIGSTIKKVEVYWLKTISQPDPGNFCRMLSNQTILKLERRGKYLIFSLSSGDYLCVHLRMTGRLLLVKGNPADNPHIRLRLKLDDDRMLDFYDTRKFGRWSLVRDLSLITGKIGPEPLSPGFTPQLFWKMLQKHSRALKPLLLDQSFLAGLGNIYVDESLWDSQLHPLRRSNEVTQEEAKRLHQSIRKVLKRGIESQGTTLGQGKSNYYRLDGTKGQNQTLLRVFRQTGMPCPRCAHIIERIVVGQRSTHLCPVCQQI